MNKIEINNLIKILKRKHEEHLHSPMTMVHTNLLSNKSNSIWLVLLKLLEHLVKYYFDGKKFTIKIYHFRKHYKTIKYVTKLFKELYKILRQWHV